MAIERYFVPTTIKDAERILAEEEGAQPLAGGTAIEKTKNVRAVVDLSRLGLSYIKKEGKSLKIGAMTTLEELSKSKSLTGSARALKQAAESTDSRPLRNVITLGGDVIAAHFWCMAPVALLALDASMVTSKGKTYEMTEVVSKSAKNMLGMGEFVTEFILPNIEGNGAFLKFARTHDEYPFTCAAACLQMDGKKCAKARIAVGAVEARARRLEAVEGALEGKVAGEVLGKIDDMVSKEVNPRHDFRASGDYLKHITGVIARRALEDALGVKK